MDWNPSRVFYEIPYFNYPIMWYGVLFALGFFVSYLLIIKMYTRDIPNDDARFLADKLILYIVVGTLIGARLGNILFYDLWYYLEHPLEIFARGGLASHGGAIGILTSLALFCRKYKDKLPTKTYLGALDYICPLSALTGVFIRIGNFVNQEIVGTETTLPWAVQFLRPYEGLPALPRHPVQLYEAGAYLLIFAALYIYWKKRPPEGRVAGLSLICIFTARLFLEFFKVSQSAISSSLDMGQWLSIPFILLGITILRYSR